ncbi:hypothetical protein [Streptomyces sp. MC1]|uniref:hypothetical protein n=1 Tax=Streptomyces sp. MC1 TaxID=295105 RepID=UPI001E52BE42|nr:hypothetical protein [Streptomyces sp. MC1]
MERWTRPEDERLLTGKGRYVADIHDGHLGSTGSPALDLAVLADARRMLDRAGTPASASYERTSPPTPTPVR